MRDTPNPPVTLEEATVLSHTDVPTYADELDTLVNAHAADPRSQLALHVGGAWVVGVVTDGTDLAAGYVQLRAGDGDVTVAMADIQAAHSDAAPSERDAPHVRAA